MTQERAKPQQKRRLDHRLIEHWIRMANSTAGIRDDKVARVREAIRADRYDVAPRLDEALMRLERDMDEAPLCAAKPALDSAQ